MRFKAKAFIVSIFIFALIISGYLYSDDKKEPKPPPYESWYDSLAMIQAKEEQAIKKEEPKYQTWKLPIYMQENLQWMLDDFNKRFDEKVQAYKKELKARFAEFKDMPDDVVLYLEGGIFIDRADFLKLQQYIKDTEELKNKQKGGEKKDG